VTDDTPNTDSLKLNIGPIIVEIFTPGLFWVLIPSSMVGGYRYGGLPDFFLRVETLWSM
jgi:hypothetical protein